MINLRSVCLKIENELFVDFISNLWDDSCVSELVTVTDGLTLDFQAMIP
jgi:hypothetical protein